jgi:hydroquinone glucosyltransferase
VVALVADPLATQALEISKEFNLLSFIYFPLSAMATSIHLYLPTLHEQISCEYIDHTILMNLSLADGVLINTFEMEESTVSSLQEKYNMVENNTEVYMVGPIIQSGSNSTEPNESHC